MPRAKRSCPSWGGAWKKVKSIWTTFRGIPVIFVGFDPLSKKKRHWETVDLVLPSFELCFCLFVPSRLQARRRRAIRRRTRDCVWNTWTPATWPSSTAIRTASTWRRPAAWRRRPAPAPLPPNRRRWRRALACPSSPSPPKVRLFLPSFIFTIFTLFFTSLVSYWTSFSSLENLRFYFFIFGFGTLRRMLAPGLTLALFTLQIKAAV